MIKDLVFSIYEPLYCEVTIEEDDVFRISILNHADYADTVKPDDVSSPHRLAKCAYVTNEDYDYRLELAELPYSDVGAIYPDGLTRSVKVIHKEPLGILEDVLETIHAFFKGDPQ